LVEAVTFDVGGTLIEPWPSVGAVYAAVAAEHGHDGLEGSALTRRFVGVWRRRGSFRYTRAAWARVVDATFAGLVRPRPSRTFFGALYERFGRAESWKVFRDVAPVLGGLRARGVRLESGPMVTSAIGGIIKEDPAARAEFLRLAGV
jgi:FMN phosphatase YigB (HAD superfamily)